MDARTGLVGRWTARALARPALALALAGCASLAGVEDPTAGVDALAAEPPPRRESPASTTSSGASDASTTSSGASTTTTTTTTTSTPSGADAGPGSATPPPGSACSRKPDGEACGASSECCGKCNEARTCAPTCAEQLVGCNPLEAAPCCVGLYCSAGFCATCVPDGDYAPWVLGQRYAKACCSKRVDKEGRCREE